MTLIHKPLSYTMKIKKILAILLSALMLASLPACISAPDQQIQTKKTFEFPPISDQDTDEAFRAVGVGIGKDLFAARDAAYAAAQGILVSKIRTKIDTAAEKTVKTANLNDQNVISVSTCEAISGKVTNLALYNMTQYTETMHKQRNNGEYEVWLGLEIPRTLVVDISKQMINSVAATNAGIDSIKDFIKRETIKNLLDQE